MTLSKKQWKALNTSLKNYENSIGEKLVLAIIAKNVDESTSIDSVSELSVTAIEPVLDDEITVQNLQQKNSFLRFKKLAYAVLISLVLYVLYIAFRYFIQS